MLAATSVSSGQNVYATLNNMTANIPAADLEDIIRQNYENTDNTARLEDFSLRVSIARVTLTGEQFDRATQALPEGFRFIGLELFYQQDYTNKKTLERTTFQSLVLFATRGSYIYAFFIGIIDQPSFETAYLRTTCDPIHLVSDVQFETFYYLEVYYQIGDLAVAHGVEYNPSSGSVYFSLGDKNYRSITIAERGISPRLAGPDCMVGLSCNIQAYIKLLTRDCSAKSDYDTSKSNGKANGKSKCPSYHETSKPKPKSKYASNYDQKKTLCDCGCKN